MVLRVEQLAEKDAQLLQAQKMEMVPSSIPHRRALLSHLKMASPYLEGESLLQPRVSHPLHFGHSLLESLAPIGDLPT